MRTHITAVGVLNIAHSVIDILVGLIVIMISGGVGVMLTVFEDVPLVGTLAASGIGMMIGFFILALGLPGLFGGIGVLRHEAWGRIVILIVSVLNLLNCPFGTALGIYSLWVLLQQESVALFEDRGDYRYD